MSNKLIKNKNFTSKELEYYKNHCALLEKELEEERKKEHNLKSLFHVVLNPVTTRFPSFEI